MMYVQGCSVHDQKKLLPKEEIEYELKKGGVKVWNCAIQMLYVKRIALFTNDWCLKERWIISQPTRILNL